LEALVPVSEPAGGVIAVEEATSLFSGPRESARFGRLPPQLDGCEFTTYSYCGIEAHVVGGLFHAAADPLCRIITDQ